MKHIESFSTGIHAFFDGFSVYTKKGLKRYVYIPLFINVVIFSACFYFGFEYAQTKINHIDYTLPSFLSFLQSSLNYVMSFLKMLITVLVTLIMLIVMGLSASVIANLISSPFNAFLAEKKDHQLTGFIPPAISVLKLTVTALSREIYKLIYFIPRAILTGVLFAIVYFIPVINIFAPFILYIFGAWMLAFQYLDYAADNRQVSIADLKGVLKQHRHASLGFGLMCMLFTSIPVVNLVILPVCVAGAVALWTKLID